MESTQEILKSYPRPGGFRSAVDESPGGSRKGRRRRRETQSFNAGIGEQCLNAPGIQGEDCTGRKRAKRFSIYSLRPGQPPALPGDLGPQRRPPTRDTIRCAAPKNRSWKFRRLGEELKLSVRGGFVGRCRQTC